MTSSELCGALDAFEAPSTLTPEVGKALVKIERPLSYNGLTTPEPAVVPSLAAFPGPRQ